MTETQEVAALKLGAAVVKTVMSLWVGPASVITDGAVELVLQRAENAMERRQGERFFSQCEEIVARRVLSLLGKKALQDLPSNEREAATVAVARTFDTANLSEFELVDLDLDPDRLLQRLLEASRRVLRQEFLRGGQRPLRSTTARDLRLRLPDGAYIAWLPRRDRHGASTT